MPAEMLHRCMMIKCRYIAARDLLQPQKAGISLASRAAAERRDGTPTVLTCRLFQYFHRQDFDEYDIDFRALRPIDDDRHARPMPIALS